ncbi:MAG: DUF4465 domain-containing protein [Sporocytophaga sp.]|nr:DUF4465 domain-containing protein [Sporocytophaga sp.]
MTDRAIHLRHITIVFSNLCNTFVRLSVCSKRWNSSISSFPDCMQLTMSIYKYILLIGCLLLCQISIIAQPYPEEATLPEHAQYYTLDVNSFDNFLNGVWRDVYNWDSGKEAVDHTGRVIGGWKQLYQDNIVFDHYTEYGGSWEGFCVSNRDFAYQRPDPLNQFTATTLGGKDGIGKPYLVAYYGWASNRENSCRLWLNDGIPCEAAGMYVTNTYYNYLSLLSGSGLSRAFVKGDWFLLSAYGYDETGSHTGSSELYLADYRSENPDEHYIINDWRWFDLSALGKITSVEFILTSSDNSEYGMNTPSYFCMDKFTLSLVSVKDHPQEQTVCENDSAIFHARIAGSDYYNSALKDYVPRLQWRKDSIDIPGANDTTLVIYPCKKSDEGRYSCYAISEYQTEAYSVIYNDEYYKAEVLSEVAHLTVLNTPQITQHPLTQNVVINEDISLSIGHRGDIISCQWYKDGQKLEQATNETLLIPSAQYADSGNYHCIIYYQCGEIQSHKAKLNIKDLPPAIHEPPRDTIICEGETLILNIGASGSSLKYQWMKGNLELSGETNPQLLLKDITSDWGDNYSCIVSNSNGRVISSSVKIAVTAGPKITIQPKPASVEKDNNITLSIVAQGAGLSYQWFKEGQTIPDSNKGTLILGNVTESDEGFYYCSIQSACGTEISDSVKVSVYESSVIYPNPCEITRELYFKGYEGYTFTIITGHGQELHSFPIRSPLQSIIWPYQASYYTLKGEKDIENADGSKNHITIYKKIIIR